MLCLNSCPKNRSRLLTLYFCSFRPSDVERESSYDTGVLVSKVVDVNIDGVILKPAGESLLWSRG